MNNIPNKIYAYKYGISLWGFSEEKLKSKGKLFSICEFNIRENPKGQFCLFDPFKIVEFNFIKESTDFIRIDLYEDTNEKEDKAQTKETKRDDPPKKQKRKIKLLKKNNKK